MATNPAVSLPQAGEVRDALRKLDLFVVSENVRSNDTVNAGADVLLPASAWGEKDGTVTNSERRISRQRAFLAPPGEAAGLVDLAEVAKVGFGQPSNSIGRMCFASTPHPPSKMAQRDFDIGALALSDQLDALSPVQYTLADAPSNRVSSPAGYTPDGGAHVTRNSQSAPLYRRFYRSIRPRPRPVAHTARCSARGWLTICPNRSLVKLT